MPMIRARPVRGKRRRRISGTAPESRSTSEIARPIERAVPARTPRASSSDAGGRTRGLMRRREQLLGDDELLDLARALADRAELDVAVELLDREVLREPVAAVDLDRAVGRAHRDLGGVELGLRRELRDGLPRVLGRRRPLASGGARRRSRSPSRRGRTGSPGTRQIGLAELPALASSSASAASYAPRARPTDSAAIEMRPPSRIFIESTQPAPSRAEQVRRRERGSPPSRACRCRRPACRACSPSCRRGCPGLSSSTMKAEMPRVALGPVGHRHQDRDAADRGVRDEVLRAVQDPGLAVADGRRLRAARVRPGLGLRQAPGREPLAGGQLRACTCCRCASVPNWKMWFEPRLLCAASDSATDGSTLEISSTIAGSPCRRAPRRRTPPGRARPGTRARRACGRPRAGTPGPRPSA